jgi:hypothetical protein
LTRTAGTRVSFREPHYWRQISTRRAKRAKPVVPRRRAHSDLRARQTFDVASDESARSIGASLNHY